MCLYFFFFRSTGDSLIASRVVALTAPNAFSGDDEGRRRVPRHDDRDDDDEEELNSLDDDIDDMFDIDGGDSSSSEGHKNNSSSNNNNNNDGAMESNVLEAANEARMSFDDLGQIYTNISRKRILSKVGSPTLLCNVVSVVRNWIILFSLFEATTLRSREAIEDELLMFPAR